MSFPYTAVSSVTLKMLEAGRNRRCGDGARISQHQQSGPAHWRCVRLIYVEVKCSKMGKQPCPVCLGGCRAPAENALVMTLITAMALQVLVPATLTKDRFMLCKSVPPQKVIIIPVQSYLFTQDHLLLSLHTAHTTTL